MGLERVRMNDPNPWLTRAADIDVTALHEVLDKSAGGVLAVRRRDQAHAKRRGRDRKAARLRWRTHQQRPVAQPIFRGRERDMWQLPPGPRGHAGGAGRDSDASDAEAGDAYRRLLRQDPVAHE